MFKKLFVLLFITAVLLSGIVIVRTILFVPKKLSPLEPVAYAIDEQNVIRHMSEDGGIDPVTRKRPGTRAACRLKKRMVFANRWLFGPLLENALTKNPIAAAMLHTTIAPTMLNAGIKANVLAPEQTQSTTRRFRMTPIASIPWS